MKLLTKHKFCAIFSDRLKSLDFVASFSLGLFMLAACSAQIRAPLSKDRNYVLLDNIAPTILSVTAPGNGTYLQAQMLDFNVLFSEPVLNAGGTRIPITVGSSTRYATYLSGSGSANLLYRYTVGPGENDLDGIAIGSSVSLNGGSVADAAGNDAVLSYIPPNTLLVDVNTNIPSIIAVSPPADGSYRAAQNLDFALTFSEPVNVSALTQLSLDIGGVAHFATYVSGTGTANILYRYTVVSPDTDADGLIINSPLLLNGGTIKGLTAVDAGLVLISPNTTALCVDTAAPTILSVTAPADGTYKLAQNLDFSVTFSESVVVGMATRLAIDIGGVTRYANYLSSAGNGAIYRYTTVAPDLDSNGIGMTSPLGLNGGTVLDLAGNTAVLTFALPNTTALLVDAVLPTLLSIAAPANATYNAGSVLSFTATFSENVSLTGTTRLQIDIGGVTRYANYFSGSGTSLILYRYTVASPDFDSDGIAMTSPLGLNGGTIQDAALNNAVLTYSAPVTTLLLVDAVAPVITSINAPADATYKSPQNLDFVVNWSKTVNVTGTPVLQVNIGGTIRNAAYLSGTGTSALSFRYPLLGTDKDTDGIALVSPLTIPSATIRDTNLNAAVLTFTPPTTTGVLVAFPDRTIGGNVSGMTVTTGLVLKNNGGDALTRNGNGNFVFATSIVDSAAYAVTVFTNPSGVTCQVTSGGSGTASANVTNVQVECFSDARCLSAASSTPVGFQAGVGSAVDPWLICRKSQLNQIVTQCVSGNSYCSGYVFSLIENLNYEGAVSFSQIPQFQGKFYGNNKELQKITTTANGIFGSLTGAEIHTLKLKGVSVTLAGATMGLLAGTATSTLIEGCTIDSTSSLTSPSGASKGGALVGNMNFGQLYDTSSQASVSAVGNSSYMGGLIGEETHVDIDNVTVTSTINCAATSFCGGIIGSASGFSSVSELRNATATVTLTCGSGNCGGLIGDVGNTSHITRRGNVSGNISMGNTGASNNLGGATGRLSGTLEDTHSTTNLSATGSDIMVGGIAGSSSGTIQRCSSSGSVTAASTNNVGALLGQQNGGPTYDSWSSGTVTGLGGVGGLLGSSLSSSISRNYSLATITAGAPKGSFIGSIAGTTGVDNYALNAGLATGWASSTLKTTPELQSQTAAAMATATVFNGWTFAPTYNAAWRVHPGTYPENVSALDWTNLTLRYWKNFKQELDYVKTFGVSGAATASTFGANAVVEAFVGAVVAPNGFLYVIPYGAQYVQKVNLSTRAITNLTATDLTTSNHKWAGGVLAPNGKIFAVSENSSNLLVINTSTDAVTITADANIAAQNTSLGTWRGGVLSPQGMIYWAPYGARYMLKLNPTTNVTSLLPYDFTTANYKYSGLALSNNGSIYLIPQQADKVAKLDPATDTVTMIGPSLPDSLTNRYVGGALAPSGVIYGIPREATAILKIDTNTDTVTQFSNAGVIPAVETTAKWRGGVLAANGKIYGIPFASTSVLEIDPATDTFIRFGSVGAGSTKWFGGILTPSGKIWGIPHDAATYLEIDSKANSDMNMAIPLSPYYNKF